MAAKQETAIKFLLLMTLIAILSESAAHDDSRPIAPTPPSVQTDLATSAPTLRSESLLLQGYNYTDHYIDSFSVNGQGGGNIFESSPTSGGGGSVCCIVWNPGSKLPVKIRVRWVAGYCMFREKNPYSFGERYHEKRRSLWKEQDALITRAVVDNPRALEIHFYRDERIEAAVTQGDSPPRLKLPRGAKTYDRPGVSQQFPRCSDDEK